MATDPTTAEKAERLGLRKRGRAWLSEFGNPRVYPATRGGFHVSGLPDIFPTEEAAIDALDRCTEDEPPDYRAALERLVDVAEQIENAGPGHEDWGALTKAIALARKVLHGQ